MLSIPGGLKLFLRLFVLDSFVVDVLVYCFYVDIGNCDNYYNSYEVIVNNFCICYYN